MTSTQLEHLQRQAFGITPGITPINRAAFYKLVEYYQEQAEDIYLGKAIELWTRGWVSETPHRTQTQIMNWYWRRPARPGRKKGRLFLSTDQALNAMRKEKAA